MPLIDIIQRMQNARFKELPSLIEKIAVMFIDLAGSTDYKDKKGIEQGTEKVIIFNLDVTEIVNRATEEYKKKEKIERGEICKYIGDEVMAYFVGRNSAKVAMEIAINIQKHFESISARAKEYLEKYQPKIGIDWGDVLFAQYNKNLPLDPYGLTVDRAARIVRLAKPGQILVSEEVKNRAKGIDNVSFGAMEKRKFKGIEEETGIYEVIWKEPLGIKFEEEPLAFTISADAPTVYQFIKDENLLPSSKQIDLCLYTYETLAYILRDALEKLDNPLKVRVLVRHPLKDQRKEANIKASMGVISETMHQNRKITFAVRFYDEEPLLRAYIFHGIDNTTKGLVGMYRHDFAHPMRFVGAEDNNLLVTKDRSLFERHLLNMYANRFNYLWNKLTIPKAVIFDLDGVIIDSMPFHYAAWQEAFAEVGIDVPEEEIYQREGEKGEITAKEVYKKFKNEEPASDLVRFITKTKRDKYRDKFELRVMPGIPELLITLKNKDLKLALVTGSSLQVFQQFRKNCSLFELFDVIITGEDTRNGKPAPDPYIMAVKKLDIPSTNCYVVENGPLGIKSAVSANLTCFVIKGSSPLPEKALQEAGAKFIFKDIAELETYLIWADTNIHLKEFINIFESILRNR